MRKIIIKLFASSWYIFLTVLTVHIAIVRKYVTHF